ncbi:MAG TPA: fasciclin domain-containing protein [Polyangiales bacterium]|nr:fasciclin domain-containing protein [Polyangiales bacterium]
MQNRLWLRAVLGLGLALGTACGDDEDGGDDRTPADTGVRDAAAPLDSASPLDSATPDAARDASLPSIVEIALADSRFTTLAAAVQRAGLVTTLTGPGPLTVFAPTNDAFAKLPAGTLDALSVDQLKGVLTYHAVNGRAVSSSLKSGPVDTLAELSAFVTVSGGSVKVNDANVTTADVQASNGVVHVIDTVLLPPNLVEAAQYAGSFTTLVSAVGTAGLAEALSDETASLTVFAPTDAAFAALPPGTLAGLSTTELADVLKYHVLPTEVLSTQLTAGAVNTLLTGKQVTISLTPSPKVNDANIIIKDVRTTNGVIHAIDKVLTVP